MNRLFQGCVKKRLKSLNESLKLPRDLGLGLENKGEPTCEPNQTSGRNNAQ